MPWKALDSLPGLSSSGPSHGPVSSASLYEVAARVFRGITTCNCESISPEMAVPLTGWQGVIDFRGRGSGSVGVHVSTGYAELLAAAMAGEDARRIPAMQADAVGETVNILSSSVLALLYGPRRHVQTSSPRVSSDAMGLPSGNAEGLVTLGVLVDHEHVVQVWLSMADELGGRQ